MISGMPASCATSASAATSVTSPEGLVTISANTNRVFSVIAARKASASSPATKVVSTPKRRSVTSSWVMVPP